MAAKTLAIHRQAFVGLSE